MSRLFNLCLIRLFTGSTRVWIVGSSLVKNAFHAAKRRPGGSNLGLARIGVSIWWDGVSGMSVLELENKLKDMMNYENPPKLLVIHLAGNDIGHHKVGNLRIEVKDLLNWVNTYLPNTTMVWSQILPRDFWRYNTADNNEAMDKCRYRINNFASNFVIQKGGRYIRYPDLTPIGHYLEDDKVHLNDLGNDIFLNTIQGAIEYFVKFPNYYHTYPCGVNMFSRY